MLMSNSNDHIDPNDPYGSQLNPNGNQPGLPMGGNSNNPSNSPSGNSPAGNRPSAQLTGDLVGALNGLRLETEQLSKINKDQTQQMQEYNKRFGNQSSSTAQPSNSSAPSTGGTSPLPNSSQPQAPVSPVIPPPTVKIDRGSIVRESARQQNLAPTAPITGMPTAKTHSALPTDQLYKTSRGTNPHMGGKVGQAFGEDLNKNMLQLGHMMNPTSFMQYALMFGAGFPMQMKMAETITAPVMQTNEKFQQMKGFASGFTGIGDAVKGFGQQMSQSPFKMYEGLYQSKILLSSALGGERASNKAIGTALNMAREYPVKTEQVLTSLSRLAVYPQVKPHLKSENFQKKLMEAVSGLSLVVPEQGMEGAMFSLVEAMSGSWRSLQMRFNISPEVVESLSGMTKGEMSSDPTKLVEGLHRFVGKAVGLDVLEKQKYTFSKQVDNFGDTLQLATRNVFESTGLYRTISGGATAFQTGFGGLAENRGFLNFIGGITKPMQDKMDGAFARFAGIGVGQYKLSPLSTIASTIEENFEDMSMDEIAGQFSGLIDDLGGIWKDTNNTINRVVNAAFGDTLSNIGSDIASVVGNDFAGMTFQVLQAFGTSMITNPLAVGGAALSFAPLLVPLLGVQLAMGSLQKAFSGKTMAQRRLVRGEVAFGTESFKKQLLTNTMNRYNGGEVTSLDSKGKYKNISTSSQNDNRLINLLNAEENDKFSKMFQMKDTGMVSDRMFVNLSKSLDTFSGTLVKNTSELANNSRIAMLDTRRLGFSTAQSTIRNQLMNKLSVDALGLGVDGTAKKYKTLAEVSDSDFKKSKFYTDTMKEDTVIRQLSRKNLPDGDKMVRALMESNIQTMSLAEGNLL